MQQSRPSEAPVRSLGLEVILSRSHSRHRHPCFPSGIQCQTMTCLAPKSAYANRALHRIAAEPCLCPGTIDQGGSLTCMTTSTDRPRGGPAKDRETSGNKEPSRDGIACSLTHFSVFSQVGNLGCIEFLNRVSQVRFLPGALGRKSWPPTRHRRASHRGVNGESSRSTRASAVSFSSKANPVATVLR